MGGGYAPVEANNMVQSLFPSCLYLSFYLQNVNLLSKTSWLWPTCSPPGDDHRIIDGVGVSKFDVDDKEDDVDDNEDDVGVSKVDVNDAKLDDHGQHLLLQLGRPAPVPGEVDQLGRQQVKVSQFSPMSTSETVQPPPSFLQCCPIYVEIQQY